MQTAKVVLIMLICAALTSACGLKGPLYLPADEPQPTQSTASDEVGASETEDEKELKKDEPPITTAS